MKSSYKELVSYFKQHDKVQVVEGHSAKVHTVGWNCEGRRLASGSYDRRVCLFSLDEKKLKFDYELRGHADQVDQLCWHKSHPDLLASASGDKTVRIWDARLKKGVHTVQTKGENINIVWSPDGSTIAVGNKADLISFIDTRTFKIVNNEQFKSETNEFSWNLDNNLFYVTNGSGQIIVLSWPDLKTLVTVPAHPSNIICIEFAPNGKIFAVGATDAIISVWDAANLVCVRTITRLDWTVRTIGFSYDSKILAAGSEDLAIDVAYVDTGEKICEIKLETPTFTLAWNPKQYLLAYACDDKMTSQYGRPDKDAGTIKLFGLPSISSVD